MIEGLLVCKGALGLTKLVKHGISVSSDVNMSEYIHRG